MTREIDLDGIQLDLEAIEHDAAIHGERNFRGRARAIDFIDFHILDRIGGFLRWILPKHRS